VYGVCVLLCCVCVCVCVSVEFVFFVYVDLLCVVICVVIGVESVVFVVIGCWHLCTLVHMVVTQELTLTAIATLNYLVDILAQGADLAPLLPSVKVSLLALLAKECGGFLGTHGLICALL
jgi:hypothetical protein